MKTENKLIFICSFMVIAVIAFSLISLMGNQGYEAGSQFFFPKKGEDLYHSTIENMFFAKADPIIETPIPSAQNEIFVPEVPSFPSMAELAADHKNSLLIYAQGDRFSGTIAKTIEKTLSPYGYGVMIWDISGMDLTAYADIKAQADAYLSELIDRANDAGVTYIIGIDIFNLSGYPSMRTVNTYYNDGYIMDDITSIDLAYEIETGLLENFGAYEYTVEGVSRHRLPGLLKDLLFEANPFGALSKTMTAACEVVITEGGEINEDEAIFIAKGICTGILQLDSE